VIEARSDVDDHIAQLPGKKLVHSIGTPVGASAETLAAQLPLLQEAVRRLNAPYASEHLSFNVASDFFTGFFLPPRQTAEGIRVYKKAIARLQEALAVPLAVETGVNYLRPRSDEMHDGEFVAELVESADCGILLDLHNIYCNQLNGRLPMEKFLSHIPLERVWELHIAGGFEMNGFWLDAHSGAVPEELMRISRDVLPHLPNLKALVFEIFPSFLEKFGLAAVEKQLEDLRQVWELRGGALTKRAVRERADSVIPTGGPSVQEWEQGLGAMVIGRTHASAFEQALKQDPGVSLVKDLIHEFRASMVVSVYRLTSRLLMLALTPEIFRMLLEEYWLVAPPRQYASLEANGFYSFLVSKNLQLPWFHKVYEFEHAAVLTICDGQARIMRFEADPIPMLRALAEGRLPDVVPQVGDYEIELKPDGPIAVSEMELTELMKMFPSH